MIIKYCHGCNQNRPTTEFYVSKTAKDGLRSLCKKCFPRYTYNPDYQAKMQKYRALHRDKKKAYDSSYRCSHKSERSNYYHSYKNKPDSKLKAIWRKAGLAYKYDLTEEAFRSMLEAQQGLCAICKKPETQIVRGKPRTLSIDHDHKTGRVRGLLCHKHNLVLGLVNDDITILKDCIVYLTPKEER